MLFCCFCVLAAVVNSIILQSCFVVNVVLGSYSIQSIHVYQFPNVVVFHVKAIYSCCCICDNDLEQLCLESCHDGQHFNKATLQLQDILDAVLVVPHHPLDPPGEHGPALVTDTSDIIEHHQHHQHHVDDWVAQCWVGEGLESINQLYFQMIWDRGGAKKITESHVTKRSYP